MAKPVKIRELKHFDSILNLLEPEERAILAAQGVEIDPDNPPKPYEFFELISRGLWERRDRPTSVRRPPLRPVRRCGRRVQESGVGGDGPRRRTGFRDHLRAPA